MAAMITPFVRMNGAGNRFWVVNALERPFAPGEDQVR
ncbi:MAG: diaminopimelate epimerase, partial [Brevundimonas sp.]